MVARAPSLIVGLAFITGAIVWRSAIAPHWTDRLPKGWSQVTHLSGVQTNPDAVTGKLPTRDVLGVYERSLSIASDSGRPIAIRLQDDLTIKDPATGKTTFEYLTQELVNPRTGARTEPQYRGDVAVFPREVEKHVYRLRSNYVKGLPLAFERVDDIGGIQTYLFSYHGRGEYGESYAGTADYPGIKLKPGQEIRCADDQFYLRIWIEPLTGEKVKMEEGCPSGDFIYDTKSGRQLFAASRWQGVSSGTSLAQRVERVQHMRLEYLAVARVIPLLLAAIGLAVAVGGMVPRRIVREAA